MQTLFQDLRYGARMLLKNPGFTLIAILTLALGIGANVAIFSVVNAVLIQPLPFAEPDRLVWVWGNIRNGGNRASVSPLDYLDYRAQNTTFEQFAATLTVPTFTSLTGSGEPERLEARLVTGNFFQALGVNAALGRVFQPENEKSGSERVVVLSHGLWQRRFGGEPSIIGKTLTFEGRKYEVIGVTPPSFEFPQNAEWGVELIVAFSGNNIPSTAQVGVDRVALGFTLGVSLVTGLLFGLAPALQATRPRLVETLKDGGKGAGQGALRNRTRNLLVVFETAVAMVLLIGAGLLVRSYIRLQQVNPGFDAANVITTRINLSFGKYNSPEKAGAFWAQLQERLSALPGVEAVGMITELPLSGQPNDLGFIVEGRPPVRPGQEFGADFRRVNRDYLRSMRIPLLRGRGFTEQEVRQSAKVVLISETLASGVFPDEEPLGKRLLLDRTPFEIIGVVGDIRHRTLEAAPNATMYMPTLDTGSMNLAIRATGDPMSLATAVRSEARAIDPDQPIAAVRTMDQLLSESVAAPRYRTWLLGLFAVVALVLAGVGIYGLISYAVAQRTHEIGVRMALGAQTADVLKLVIGQGIKLALAGALLGLGGALALTRLVKTLLFGVSATDPLTFAAIALLLTAVALLACWIPARRAARVDPMVALRYE